MFALDVAVGAAIEFEHREVRRKNSCNNTHTERAGAIRVVENIDSINLCLSLFAVHLEMLDLST
jgi:hypothetical protein